MMTKQRSPIKMRKIVESYISLRGKQQELGKLADPLKFKLGMDWLAEEATRGLKIATAAGISTSATAIVTPKKGKRGRPSLTYQEIAARLQVTQKPEVIEILRQTVVQPRKVRQLA